MTQAFRPSKQFLIRGGMATLIVAIILIVQTDWFRALFNKPPLPPLVSDKTVGEFIAQDSNGNGIADWEEKLWGLDPITLYTGGIPNKQIIEERKRALGVSGSAEPENETDALARELMTITTALGQSGELSSDSLADIGARLAESVEFQQYANHYSLKDIKAVQTTTASLNQYYSSFATVAQKHSASVSELDIIVRALETGEMSAISTLEPIEKEYEQYAKELTALSVPIGLQRDHLEIINSIYGLSVALRYTAELSDNGANALAGIALYKINDARLTVATENMRAYFVRYGIIE